MRLIDVDALLDQLEATYKQRESDAYYTGDRVIRIKWDDAIITVKNAPTITWMPFQEQYKEDHDETV